MEINQLKNIYDEQFWGPKRGNYNYRSAKIILPMIFKYYKPDSMIDIGCGIGTWLSAALELGIENLQGIDCNEISEDFLLVPRKYISIDDLETHKNKDNKKYDIAVSVEVAEHLNNSASEHFIKMLTSYSKVIIFSAGIPYQDGEHHINCQPPKFWYDIFSKYEYVCFDFRDKLMNMWEEINPCYSQNLLLYVHKDLAHIFENIFNITNKPIFFYHPAYVDIIVNNLNNQLLQLNETMEIKFNEQISFINKKIEEIKLNINWFSLLSIFGIQLFSISNNTNYLRLTVLGIKLTFKVNEETINRMAWWIPIKSLRNNFRGKFKIEDQTRPDQTRPDQTRPDQTRPLIYNDYIYFYNNTKNQKLQPMLQYQIAA